MRLAWLLNQRYVAGSVRYVVRYVARYVLTSDIRFPRGSVRYVALSFTISIQWSLNPSIERKAVRNGISHRLCGGRGNKK